MSPITPGLKLVVARKEVAPVVFDGIEVTPATWKKEQIKGEWSCPSCGDKGVKEGWKLEDVPGQPNGVVQCSNCRRYLWLDLVKRND